MERIEEAGACFSEKNDIKSLVKSLMEFSHSFYCTYKFRSSNEPLINEQTNLLPSE